MPPRPAGSTRRTATVASAVPDASRTASRTSMLGMPPVPRMRREARVRPSMRRSAGRRQPPAAAVTIST